MSEHQLTQKEKAALAFGVIPATFLKKKGNSYTLSSLSADTINGLSAYTLSRLSADTINSLSADTLSRLSADTLNKLIGLEIPKLERPYSKLLADIKEKRRVHQQSTWGPENEPCTETNVCGTAMCTAGHIVNMAGENGWKLKQKIGFAGAATLIHFKSHPDLPCQNFGYINQDYAMAYIEEMAAIEQENEIIK